VGGLGRLEGGGELGDGRARLHRLVHVRDGGVVVARHRQPVLAAERGDRGAVLLRVARPLLQPPLDQRVELRLGEPVAPPVVFAVLRHVDELALARRVVHQRHEPHHRIVRERDEVLHHQRGAHLAAHVEVVIGPEEPGGARGPDRLHQRAGIPRPLPGVDQVADGQAIEDGGDARAEELAVVGEHRGNLGPLHARARDRVALQHVGMELDHPGH
jgi:hypothetical protein